MTEKEEWNCTWKVATGMLYAVQNIIEDNIDAAQLRKDERYESLVKDCENSKWQVVHFPVDVGYRGFVSHRMKGWLLTLGLSHRKVNIVSKDIQEKVEKASHWMWLKRNDGEWIEK